MTTLDAVTMPMSQLSTSAERFDDAFDRLLDVAYRAAFRVLGVPAEAEDAAAEAIARAADRWKHLSTPADGWVFTVSTRLAIDRQRKAWRNLPLFDDVDPGPTGRRLHVASPEADVATHIDLVRTLSELPRRQCQAVSLRYLSDFSERETSELMRCSPSAVQTHTHRGLAALRNRLEADQVTGLEQRLSKTNGEGSQRSAMSSMTSTECNKENTR